VCEKDGGDTTASWGVPRIKGGAQDLSDNVQEHICENILLATVCIYGIVIQVHFRYFIESSGVGDVILSFIQV
jgi:hypothetical protein